LCVLGLVAIIAYAFLTSNNPLGVAEIEKYAVIASTAIFLLLGFTMVIPIGGGDMPVIISFLNALSGLAAAFAGFAINNTVLVVSGCASRESGELIISTHANDTKWRMSRRCFWSHPYIDYV